MKITKRLFSIMIMAVMIATSFGIAEVNAASGLPKISSLRASVQKTSVSISWKKLTKKQQKKVKGIAIYRDGKQIKLISKKSRSFTDSGLKAGTAYTYTVKTYKTTKKKEWFNKKTQKWQKKKPAKQYRGKSRKAKKYSAGVAVNVATTTGKTQHYTGGNEKAQPGPKPHTENYTYDIHFINEPYGHGGETAIYLETNNPNTFDYELGVLNSNNQEKKLNIIRAYYNGGPTSTSYQDLNLPFSNGYLAVCRPECTGNCTFVVYEYNDSGRNIVESKAANVKDYDAARATWRQSVINEVTTSSMSKAEKMDAICQYILANFDYTKVPIGSSPNTTVGEGSTYIELLSDAGIPYWKDKRLNSYTSPELLVEFGQDIGYSLHNCYGDYEVGSSQWMEYHYKVYSSTDNLYFAACPTYGKGAIDPSSIKMFNPDTFQFWD